MSDTALNPRLNTRLGLSESALATIRSALSKHEAINRAIVYGSRAKGNYREGSDIDLTLDALLLSDSDLSNLWHELDESNLPYLIDLSRLQDLKNSDLLEHINRVGVVLYERSQEQT